MFQKPLWTDNNHNKPPFSSRGSVPLPVGWQNGHCPKCHSLNIKGILLTPTADEQDPNIVCLDCGFWWD